MKLSASVLKGLPERAPRGRHFAVARLSHVAGKGIRCVLGDKRYELLEHAVREAEDVDWRFNPNIVLTDKEVA